VLVSLAQPASGQQRSGFDRDPDRGDRVRQQHLDRFLQTYACEKAEIEARKKGHLVTEQNLSDGSIKLTLQVGGGAK